MSSSVESRTVMPSFLGSARFARLVDTLERRVTIAVTLLLIVVIGGMFWLSHSRVVDAVSSSELSRLQTSADQLAQTLTAQAKRLIDTGAHLAATPEIRDALRMDHDTAVASLQRLVHRD